MCSDPAQTPSTYVACNESGKINFTKPTLNQLTVPDKASVSHWDSKREGFELGVNKS